MENNSWVKIYRSLLDWEWYHDVVTRDLFIHCLLKANYKDTTWKGVAIQKGEFITSLENLANELNFSVRNIRTGIKHLKSTNEITTKPTNKYTLIKIVNWRLYQFEDLQSDTLDSTQSDIRPTSKRQASDKQVTTDKELKNKRKKELKNSKSKKKTFTPPTFEDVKAYCLERKNNVDPKQFYDFFTAGNWYDSKGNKVKSWKQKVITWEKYNKEKPKPKFEKEKILDPYGNEYGSPEFDQEAYDNAPTTITY